MIKANRAAPSPAQVIQEVDDLVARHHGLRPLKTRLLNHHQNYERTHRRCPTTKDANLTTLKDKYPKIRSTILELFLSNETEGSCVFCGRISGDRLDHFHPKEHVPQYSLVSANLFWCCNACNEKKGDRLPLSDLKLFHPLFERLFRNRTVLFDVKLRKLLLDRSGDLILGLEVAPLETLSDYAKRRVRFILKELGIKDRVANRVDKQIRSFYQTVRSERRKRPSFWLRSCVARASAESRNSGNYTDYFAYRILSQERVLAQLLGQRN